MKILDCSLRDGGHLNNWSFDKKFAQDLSILGAFSGWSPTKDPVTHRYTGDVDHLGRTEEV